MEIPPEVPLPESALLQGENEHFNNCLYDIIEPFIKGRVLEINSEPNTVSSIFVQKGRRIHLSTENKAMRERLSQIYAQNAIVRYVDDIDFHRADFKIHYNESYR